MTIEVKQVITCNGCDLVINKGETYLTITTRAARSDLPRDQYVGMERWNAERKAKLREEWHLHFSCSLPADAVENLISHAATVTEWPELTEDD